MSTPEIIHAARQVLADAKPTGSFLCVIKALYEKIGKRFTYEDLLEPTGYP